MTEKDAQMDAEEGARLSDLWISLHNEVLEHARQRNIILSILLPSTFAIIGASIATNTRPFLGVLTGLAAAANSFFGGELLNSCDRAMWRIGTYSRMRLAPKLPNWKWETHMAQLGGKLAGSTTISRQCRLLIFLQVAGIIYALNRACDFSGTARIGVVCTIIIIGSFLLVKTYHEQRRYRRGGSFEQELKKEWAISIRNLAGLMSLRRITPTPLRIDRMYGYGVRTDSAARQARGKGVRGRGVGGFKGTQYSLDLRGHNTHYRALATSLVRSGWARTLI